ncbi:Gfo/Idh/MocA family oxidoreductase [uncultured Tateyamaria sp.]|uniref:Gfo/Idh/MocA family protein n=1 Tax=uncultured Tateyamaria sp. TaxID=455651 RepID=UPI002615367D|nr:Gfo/Idh/MocA family oxidoreductase [uncultured Tateyamaria sp.]
MIRVAILGGGIGAQHLEAYQALPGFNVTHLVDQDPDRRAALCDDSIVALADVDQAISADVDLIDICLPPHLHVPVALSALAAGKHVICEKPLATSMAHIDALRDAMERSERHIFPVFQYRFGPAFDQLRALKDAGLTGAPRAASLETHWNRGTDYYDVPWRGTWAGEQGGAVLGHAIHAHDLLSHFMAQITRVTARLNTIVNPIETEDSAALIFELDGGALATSSVTLGHAQDETRLRFVYEHLTATSDTNPYAPGQGAWTFTARDLSKQAQIDAVVSATPTGPAGFAGFLSEVQKSLSDQPNTSVRFEDGSASIALVTAIYASHRSGAPVTLPLDPDHPLHTGWQP